MSQEEAGNQTSPNQQITAAGGSTIKDVIQAYITGQITGDVTFHIGDRIYTRSVLEELRDFLQLAIARYASQTRGEVFSAQNNLPESPYRFLHPFVLKDVSLFFGRDEAIEELYDTVMKSRLTVLHARSGAGKTSLLQAGLAPRLIKEGCLSTHILTRAYEENPTKHLKLEITRFNPGPRPELLDHLSLPEFLGLLCADLNDVRELIIIFDQFEEFLTSLQPELRLNFMKDLNEVYANNSIPVRFILALRREHLWELDEFRRLIPDILQNRYGLPFMTPTEIREAITKPVVKLGQSVEYEPDLLDLLVDDLGNKEVELTHLQIVCTKLYQALPEGENKITLALYKTLGGTKEILSSYLNETIEQLPFSQQTAARNILKELVSSKATPRILSLDALQEQLPPETNLLEDVLIQLINTHLIRREENSDVIEYELTHAYLAREIREWIDVGGLKIKEVQDLLKQEVVSWRVHQTVLDENRLDILRSFIKHLSLNGEARDLLFRSALKWGYQVSFWLEQTEDQVEAVQRIALRLLEKPARKQIIADLKVNLDQNLRGSLLKNLWAVFEGAEGKDRRNVASVLWAFRTWLPIDEWSPVMIVLGPVWFLYSLPFIAILAGLLIVGSIAGPYVTREKAIPGAWVTIPAGDFLMGSTLSDAEFAQTLCLNGKAKNKDNCPKLDRILQWSGRQKDASLPTYSIMDNEVTNAQYYQCFNEGICQVPEGWEYDATAVNKPVTSISWVEAMTYCIWLEGRLPTEGEWEKAGRGPKGNYFPWGNEWHDSFANVEHLDAGSVNTVTSYANTDVSDYGIKNMAGNVREWTASPAIPVPADVEFKNNLLSLTDIEDNTPVTVRGGSWKNERSVAILSTRGIDAIYMRRPEIGFRCVCPSTVNCRKPWGASWIWLGKY
jgi:formylglycine-generating enzyme required for sulfatase activity